MKNDQVSLEKSADSKGPKVRKYKEHNPKTAKRIIFGVGLFLGKLNWGIAAATAAGVGIIFSAPKLVAFLSGSDANSNCPTST